MKKLFLQNFAIILFGTLFDLVTKWLVLQQSQPVFEYANKLFRFAIEVTYNNRFAFSIPSPKWLIMLVVLIIFAVVVGYWVQLLRERDIASLYLALILSGAIGNLYDRFFREGVVDFIEISIYGLSWSSFNLADVWIVFGVALWFYTSFKQK